MSNDGVGADDGVPTDSHPFEHDCILPNPGEGAYQYWGDIREGFIPAVAVRHAEPMLVITDCHVRPKQNIVFDFDR